MLFVVDGLFASIVLMIGIIILLIVFDNQRIVDNELLFLKKKGKRSALGTFFRSFSDVTHFLVPGLFGKFFCLLMIITLFLILSLFDLSFEAQLGYAILSGFNVSAIYLGHRTWLAGQQKKLLYDYWHVEGKTGLYSSGNTPHMGEVVLELSETLSVTLPAGLHTTEKIVNTPVRIKAVTKAGNLIVQKDDTTGEEIDDTLVHRYESLQTIIKKICSTLKQTSLDFK